MSFRRVVKKNVTTTNPTEKVYLNDQTLTHYVDRAKPKVLISTANYMCAKKYKR